MHPFQTKEYKELIGFLDKLAQMKADEFASLPLIYCKSYIRSKLDNGRHLQRQTIDDIIASYDFTYEVENIFPYVTTSEFNEHLDKIYEGIVNLYMLCLRTGITFDRGMLSNFK